MCASVLICLFVCLCVLQDVDAETVWVDHVSPGGSERGWMCWAREGGQEYYVGTPDGVSTERAETGRERGKRLTQFFLFLFLVGVRGFCMVPGRPCSGICGRGRAF